MEEQTSTTSASTEPATTEPAVVQNPAEPATAQPSVEQIDGGDGSVAIGGADDPYIQELQKRFGDKKDDSAAPDSDKTQEKPETADKGATSAPTASKDGKRAERHVKWWKAKSPEEKSAIAAKQDREALKKATERLKALEEEIAELKGGKEKKEPLSRENFATDEDWVNYRIDNRLMELEEEKEKKASERAQADAKNSERGRAWARAMESTFTDPEELKAASALFREKVHTLPVATSVLRYILDSGKPRLLLHIVRHPNAQKMLAPGTSELLVGARLTRIEQWLEGQQKGAKLADKTAIAATHEPALSIETGSANNIGSASVNHNRTRAAELRERQNLIFGLK